MEPFGEPCPRRQGIPVCGGSPLWNAVFDSARLKLRQVKGSKALLLLTDGFDTGSVRTWSEAAAEAQKADAAVYAIQYRGIGSSYAPQLYRLVAETAGTWFSAPSGDLSPNRRAAGNGLAPPIRGWVPTRKGDIRQAAARGEDRGHPAGPNRTGAEDVLREPEIGTKVVKWTTAPEAGTLALRSAFSSPAAGHARAGLVPS